MQTLDPQIWDISLLMTSILITSNAITSFAITSLVIALLIISFTLQSHYMILFEVKLLPRHSGVAHFLVSLFWGQFFFIWVQYFVNREMGKVEKFHWPQNIGLRALTNFRSSSGTQFLFTFILDWGSPFSKKKLWGWP